MPVADRYCGLLWSFVQDCVDADRPGWMSTETIALALARWRKLQSSPQVRRIRKPVTVRQVHLILREWASVGWRIEAYRRCINGADVSGWYGMVPKANRRFLFDVFYFEDVDGRILQCLRSGMDLPSTIRQLRPRRNA